MGNDNKNSDLPMCGLKWKNIELCAGLNVLSVYYYATGWLTIATTLGVCGGIIKLPTVMIIRNTKLTGIAYNT